MEDNYADMRSAMTASRLPGLKLKSQIRYTFPESYQYNRSQWTKYEATGFVQGLLGGQRTTEEADIIEDVRSGLENDYMYKNVYKFITGETSLDTTSWVSYCSAVMSYNVLGKSVQGATEAYQACFDRLYNK